MKLGHLEPKGALGDLGASISLMPLSIAKRLVFDLQPSRKTIQLADRSIKVPYGEFEDIPIQVGHLVVPCDFVVMEMEEDPYTPLILGRAALKTLNALINCKDDTITVEVAKEKLVFEFSKTTKMPLMEQACRMEVIDSEVACFAKKIDVKDPLKRSYVMKVEAYLERRCFLKRNLMKLKLVKKMIYWRAYLEPRKRSLQRRSVQCLLPRYH